jgi:preprotein translocase subunit YajC
MTIWMFMQQSRQQKKRQKLQSDIQVGEEVYTVGGMIGTVVAMDTNKLTIKLADNVEVLVLRSAIAGKYQQS